MNNLKKKTNKNRITNTDQHLSTLCTHFVGALIVSGKAFLSVDKDAVRKPPHPNTISTQNSTTQLSLEHLWAMWVISWHQHNLIQC